MSVIAVVGANGQVGSEVCLYLSKMPEVQVVPICRNRYGSSFLRQCGLECRHGGLTSDNARELLSGCDLVADFSLPKGNPAVVRSAIEKTLTSAFEGAGSTMRFVYISSIMAFGMGPNSKVLRNHLVARTRYGSTKRFGERLLFKLARKHKREGYVLRLGQVHGELQSATRAIKRDLKNETAYIPKGPSYAVFAFTIAEALARIAEGKEKPGLYTLVSKPEWTWKEVHEYHTRQAGLKPDIVEYENDEFLNQSIARRAVSSLRPSVRGMSSRLLEKHRELISSSFSHLFPETEQRMAASRLTRKAAGEISAFVRESQYRPYQPYQGVAPGRRLSWLTDSRITMEPLAQQVREVIQNLTRSERPLYHTAEAVPASAEFSKTL
jgi:nucleoside-diphosphate-sugar epimerase